jgi:hypothetical protein
MTGLAASALDIPKVVVEACLWDLPLPTADRKALWMIPFGHKDTVIAEWPIETDAETEDAANRRVLLSYYLYNEGKPRDVVEKLRPVVETHMRRMAPQLLANVKSLGNMLEKVRDAQSPPVLIEAYDDIEDVNTYTRKYMHGEGKNPDTEPLADRAAHASRDEVLGMDRANSLSLNTTSRISSKSFGTVNFGPDRRSWFACN